MDAAAFGPLMPWLPVTPGLDTWDANKDGGSFTTSGTTSPRPTTWPRRSRERLEDMKKFFLTEARDNQVFPVGAGLWTRLHPGGPGEGSLHALGLRRDHDPAARVRRSRAGRESNRVVVELEADEDASGVIYALGGIGGGLSSTWTRAGSSTSTT